MKQKHFIFAFLALLSCFTITANANVAKVGDTPYATLSAAIAAAEGGATVTLIADVTSSDIVTVDKAITIDGNGKTLTSTAGRAINVDTQNGAITTTIKNLTIVGDKDCQRGINIIDGSYKDTPANVTLDGVKISGVSTYGIQLATSVGSGNTITIKNSEISSWIALNINGDNQSVTVENSKLYGTAYSATDEGNTITVTGKNTIVTMTGGVISAATSEGLIGHYCGHVVEPTSNIVLNSVEAKVANEGDEVITFAVAIIEGQDGSFRTLQEALDDYAKEGDKVILLRPITVAANENVVFDLKGSTIVANAIEGAAYSAITNKGTLTIKNGTIKCNSTSSSTAYAVNTITNCGALTVENATIQNVGTGSQIGYAIDNNSTSADATLVIGEGAVIEVSGSNYFDGIRQFCNSTTADNSVTVNGGKVSSIWMQNPSDGAEGKNTKDVKGVIAINGGEVGALYLEPSATFEAEITGGYVGSISYFQEAEGRNLTAFISGGTFGMDVTDFCAEDYVCQVGEDGKYSIMSTILESYEIVDGVHGNYTNKVDMTVGTLTYERTLLSAGMWNALYLPFEIELTEEFLGNYEVAYFNDIRSYDNDNNGEIDDMDMEIIHIYEGTLKANYPYLIKAKTEDVREMKLELSNVKLYKAEENAVTCSSVFMNFAVKGSYSMKDVNDLNGALVITTNGAWEQTTDGLKPFRLYLTMEPREGSPVKVSEQAMARVRIVTRGESTDIENTKLDANTLDAIYDLQGRRVENPTTGIYIVNGKKMYIENK